MTAFRKNGAVPCPSRRELLGSVMAAGVASWLPAETSTMTPLTTQQRKTACDALVGYFRENGPKLLRPAEGILKHPSIAPSLPGKEYATQLWDWDTLWTARGLFQLAAVTKDDAMRARVAEHARGSLLNFLDHAGEGGRLPIMISTTDPDPLSGVVRGKIDELNQAKPVMAQLAMQASDGGDVAWLAERFDALLAFHASWRKRNLSRTGLFVWSNDVGIGNDNDPATFGRPPFSSANLLLNCLFYEDLKAAMLLSRSLKRPKAEQERIAKEVVELGSAIQGHCWDKRDWFYYSVDVQCEDQRAKWIPNIKAGMAMSWDSLPVRVQTFTGFLPLWCQLAEPGQAKSLLDRNYFANTHLRAAYGVRTLSDEEPMYSMKFSSNPSNWLGPVWIIANYFAWKALKNYGYTQEAAELADKTVMLLAKDLAKNESLNEYYHPDTGEGLSHHGFMDWNLLVLEMMG